ncbi:MAG: DNA methyltransferase [Chloroflexi bacterium]|nr:DNA methyltransferase [Chloroflexota bacterium]
MTTHERLADLLYGNLAFQAPAGEAHPLHALHPFAARFPHGLAGYFINSLTQPGDTVLDPMCGSGITLLEGWQASRFVIGVDLDPLARRQSAARTMALDAEAAQAAGRAALERAAELHAGASHPANPLDVIRGGMDDATRKFLDYWFLPETQRELSALILAIRAEPDDNLRNLLEVVFSSTIVTKSGGVSRARDLAHTRPHRVADKTPRRPIRVFANLVGRAANAYAAVNPDAVGESRIVAGDARDLPLPTDSVDLIVTSPPYANALDYMRAHKFSLAWLGDPIPSLTDLRAQYIGSESTGKRAEQSAPAELPALVQAVVDDLAEKDAPKSRVLRRYFVDMHAAIGEMTRVLRPGAAAVIVVGPSMMRGMLIPTHQCLADIAAAAGLGVVDVKPRNLDRDRRMMPARRGSQAETASGIELRQYTEYVIGAVKP